MSSPKISPLSKSVTMGPTMPTCAVRLEPMRSMAIITSSTGATVQTVALMSESQSTSGATAAASMGRSHKNCKMQHRQATVVARPTRRSEPRRCTSSPL